MGPGKIIPAVVDAGPLIHLAEINSLSLLSLFESVLVPDAVWSEAVGNGSVSYKALSSHCNIKRHSIELTALTAFIDENKFYDLHAGERECLFLCIQTGVRTLLTDDMTVREAARKLDIIPAGSLGIIVKACHLGLIPLADAEQRIIALYDASSLFVTETIVDLALEQLRRLA